MAGHAGLAVCKRQRLRGLSSGKVASMERPSRVGVLGRCALGVQLTCQLMGLQNLRVDLAPGGGLRPASKLAGPSAAGRHRWGPAQGGGRWGG